MAQRCSLTVGSARQPVLMVERSRTNCRTTRMWGVAHATYMFKVSHDGAGDRSFVRDQHLILTGFAQRPHRLGSDPRHMARLETHEELRSNSKNNRARAGRRIHSVEYLRNRHS